MEATLFIFYLLLFIFIITRLSFFTQSGLQKWELISLFILKIAAGFAYAWFYTLPQYFKGSDTWRFYRLSLNETDWLKSNPAAFVKDLFVHGYRDRGNVFSSSNNYWNDLKSNVPVKLMALFNVFTSSSYYTNIIFFNFLFFIGLVALYKVFFSIYNHKKYAIIIGVFLMPSTLFWCSGIHKDGLILSATGVVVYVFYRMLQNGFSSKYLLSALVCSLLIFVLRNYVLLALLPALGCWYICTKWPVKSGVVFSIVYITGILLFFVSPYISHSVNLPGFVVDKQHEFLKLEASSVLKIPVLEPTLKSFIQYFPYAFDMIFFRPHFTEIKNVSYLPAVTEVIFLVLLFVFILFKTRLRYLHNPQILFFIFFSLTVLFICGYIVPYSGAIVRYRSLLFPFLFTPLLAGALLEKQLIKK